MTRISRLLVSERTRLVADAFKVSVVELRNDEEARLSRYARAGLYQSGGQ